MRTHHQIIDAAGGAAALARAIGVEPGTAKQWKRLDSIPAPYWAEIVRQEFATLEELAGGAEAKRLARAAAETDEAA